jgi:peptide/nickel transport system permease protein
MASYLIRRLIQMAVVILITSFVAYILFYIAPGGPLQQLAELRARSSMRLDTGATERVMKRYELDLYHMPRYLRWLIGEPRGRIYLFGQEVLGAVEIGCLQEGKAQKVYPDGRVEETNCVKPVYLKDLEGRTVSNGILRLDFGLSQQILRERPVMTLVESRLVPTLLLMGLSNLLAIIIAVPIGIYSAVKQYSRFDYVVTTVTFFGSAMPTLFLGIMAILFFGILFKDMGLPYLPTGLAAANRDTTVPLFGTIAAGSLADHLWHLTLPVAVLTFVSLTAWSRFVRSSMLEVLRQDYVRTARAKGLTEPVVITKHALRNALIPFVTLLAGLLPALFGGAIITETVFSWPGIGRLYIDALRASDYPVSLAILLISTVLTLIGFLLTDILYTIVDPRIKFS